MKKHLKGALITLVALMTLTGSVGAFSLFESACKKAPDSPTCQQASKQAGSSTNPAVETINNVADIVAVVTGVAAVVMIMYSGFLFITGGGIAGGQRAGDASGGAKKARSTLAAAVIGLVIVALAWTITRFITDKLIK